MFPHKILTRLALPQMAFFLVSFELCLPADKRLLKLMEHSAFELWTCIPA